MVEKFVLNVDVYEGPDLISGAGWHARAAAGGPHAGVIVALATKPQTLNNNADTTRQDNAGPTQVP